MKYTGITYRPPFEADSLLLQVTQGCSHNRCSFCTMYRDIPFQIERMEQIEQDIREAGQFLPHARRVFLVNGDAFVLSAHDLAHIAQLIRSHLPAVDTIAMYASVRNIQGKTDDELKQLRALGVNDLNIGLESGLESVLIHMNKGYSAGQALHELQRLDRAGMSYGVNVILGAAGAKHFREHAEATTDLLNKTKVSLIFTGTVHADPGCPLFEEMQNGSFEESTFEEYLLEEEILLKRLTLEGCLIFGLHPSNVVPLRGYLCKDKEKMLLEIQKRRRQLGERLHTHPIRCEEGAIIQP